MMHLFGGTNGEYTYKDGSLYVSKSIASGFPFGNLPEKVWFRCMESDGDGFFRIVLFGGLFGIHKFVTRQYMQGILYLITCGGCGVFYLYDLIAIQIKAYDGPA